MPPKNCCSAEHERLVNAAHRFAKIAQDDPAKLFSLLYMLDIRLYRETGGSCTGETYYAMADGPAPGTLRPLLAMRDMDMHSAIGILTATDARGPWPFEAGHYCQRSLAILHELEAAHRKTSLRDLSLGDCNAWWRVYTNSRGVGAAIPYETTLCGRGAGLGKAAERKLPRPDSPLLIPFLAPGRLA